MSALLRLRLGLLLRLILFRGNQRAKYLVHVDEVMPIVVLVGGVVNCVVPRSHDRMTPACEAAPTHASHHPTVQTDN